jgi:hypothetical protein
MRFSIRDLLWAIVVVAMGLAWWSSYRAMDARLLAAAQQARDHRTALTRAKQMVDVICIGERVQIKDDLARRIWSVLDEPLVEP